MLASIDLARAAARQARGLKGIGHIPNGSRTTDAAWLGATPAHGADGEDYDSLEPFIEKVVDQGQANSCVAMMLCGIAALRESVCDRPYDPPSAHALYSMSRQKDGIVGDVGSRIRTAAAVMQKHGLPKESAVPYNALRVGRGVDANKLVDGWNGSGMKYEHIFSQGEAMMRSVDAALRAGFPVGFGMMVEQRFMDHTGASVFDAPKPGAKFIGGHALAIVAPRNEQGVYRILNTYGTTWGDHGLANVSQEYIVNYARDLTIIFGWKRSFAKERQA